MNSELENNPWKGLESYSYSDESLFYGRSNETEALVDTIINNRFTILYGPSGVGKSSLLNAGIRPKLTKDKFFVVEVSMRFLDLNSNETISSQILSHVQNFADQDKIDITPLSKDQNKNDFGDSLWYFFHTNEFWSSRNELLIPIVIIDQFEDIFKDEVTDNSAELFFSNLDDLSNVVPPISIREKIQDLETFRYKQSSDFRFVFSLREDYLPRLDDYVYSINIPELRKSRYGITLMNSNQAREVILGPSKEIVSEPVAKKIIDLLSVQSSHNRLSNRIEPFLLSLFMHEAYIEMVNRGLNTISEDLINMIGADIVNDFYMKSMNKVSSKARKHLENVLLTPKGNRDSISHDKLMMSEKVTEKELDTLLEAKIIKKNLVNGDYRYEFTHDIISKYALKNKEKREQESQSWLWALLGSILIIALSLTIGWVKSALLTYISIPIFVVAAIVCSFGVINYKFDFEKNSTRLFLCTILLLAVCINMTQIIPFIGFIVYVLVGVVSFYSILKLIDKTMTKRTIVNKYGYALLIWGFSVIVTPLLCFGYNIFIGLNYSRGQQFSYSSELFYIKSNKGKFGLRDRWSIAFPPEYDDTLQYVENGFIVKIDGKYGVLDQLYNTNKPAEYDSIFICEDSLCYIRGNNEYFDNGLIIPFRSVADKKWIAIRRIVRNMIPIEGGQFMMGVDESKKKRLDKSFNATHGEENCHKVTLNGFYLNKYEVTIGDYRDIMGDKDTRQRKAGKILETDNSKNMRLPVYKISYPECDDFIKHINELTGLQFSLPTEAQWEYAARGGNKQDSCLYSGSDVLYDVGWGQTNSLGRPQSVGGKKANQLGLYDMTGNVSEFCKDFYSKSFYKESDGDINPCYNKEGKFVIIRGGAFDGPETDCLVTTRNMREKTKHDWFNETGFRLALNTFTKE